jgi:hypothetical protein
MINKVVTRAISPLKTVGFRTFFVSTAKRRPIPLVKRIVVHLGMPKAASTSIQLALHEAQESRLTPAGIWYIPPNGILTDYLLYDMLAAQDLEEVRAYARTKIASAKKVGAETVIFSAERLFTLDDMSGRLELLGELLSELAEEVCFCVVVREIRSFMRSYIVQMIYNGAVPLENSRLAEWTARQLHAIAECRFPVKLLPLNHETESLNLAETLIATTTGQELLLRMGRINVTPFRPISYALAEGLAARLHALPRKEDVNSVAMDCFRTEFADSFDETVRASKDRGEVHRVLYGLDALLEEKIAEYIERSLEICPPDLMSYYNGIVHFGDHARSADNLNEEVSDAA